MQYTPGKAHCYAAANCNMSALQLLAKQAVLYFAQATGEYLYMYGWRAHHHQATLLGHAVAAA